MIGGGLYGEWTSASISGLVVKASVAQTAGGCVAFLASSSQLTGADLSNCSASSGGGMHVTFGSAIGLVNTSITSSTGINGAGVYVDASSLAGTGVNVTKSAATGSGGGVFVTGVNSSLSGLAIRDCSAPQGGGIAALKATQASLSNLEITRNNVTEDGGGIHASQCDLTVTNSRAANNTAASDGGGLYLSDSIITGTLTLAFNEAVFGGGAASMGTAMLANTVLESNSAQIGGGGVYTGDGELTLREVDVQSCVSPNGGGVYVSSARLFHDQVRISKCTAETGGGMYMDASSFTPVAANASAVAALNLNKASNFGGGVYLSGNDTKLSGFRISMGSAISGGGIAAEWAWNCSIINGVIGNSTVTSHGGGAYFGEDAHCLFTNSVVELNNASVAGGGVAVYKANLNHSNLVIRRNQGKNGGGLFLSNKADAVPWIDTAFQRSLLDANLAGNQSLTGANAKIECAVNCVLSGFCITRGVVLYGKGGGVHISGKGKVLLAGVAADSNKADSGGGVFINGSSSTVIQSCSFTHNIADDHGGGLSVESVNAATATIEVTDSVFYNNTANNKGGAMYLEKSNLIATSLLVLENRATQTDSGTGGGAHAYSLSYLSIDNSLFLLNRACSGGSIAVDSESEATINGSTITGDTKKVTSAWAAMFRRLVGSEYLAKQANLDFSFEGTQYGDLVYLSGVNTQMDITSSLLTNGSAELGGGASVGDFAVLTVTRSTFSNNSANEAGGSVLVSNTARVYFLLSEISSSSE